jgi:hypothetical protein
MDSLKLDTSCTALIFVDLQRTDLRIVWAVDAGVFVATNFLCCLAIFYVVYLMLRKRL